MFEGVLHLRISFDWLQLALTATAQDCLGTQRILVTAVLQNAAAAAAAAAVAQQVAPSSG